MIYFLWDFNGVLLKDLWISSEILQVFISSVIFQAPTVHSRTVGVTLEHHTRSAPLISYPAVLRAQQQEGGYEFVFLESLFPHLLAGSPASFLPPPFRQFEDSFRRGRPRNHPSGEPGGVVAWGGGGGGDDHASEAGGAAAGAPDPVGPILLRRARRLLAQPPHLLQVRLPSTCCHLISNLVRFTVNLMPRE